MQEYDLCLLIKEPTCFRSHNPTLIDNFLTNQKAMFKISGLFKTASDYHKLISVVIKSEIFPGPLWKKTSRSYKNFDIEHFKIALKSELEKLKESACNEFETAFWNVLKNNSPIKGKMLRRNNNSFMSKNFRKAVMHRSKFKNCFNNCHIYENWCNYKTQRNYCIRLLRKTKQQYFKNLKLNDNLTNSKTIFL